MAVELRDVKSGSNLYLIHPVTKKIELIMIVSIIGDIISFNVVEQKSRSMGYVQLMVHNLFYTKAEAEAYQAKGNFRTLSQRVCVATGTYQLHPI